MDIENILLAYQPVISAHRADIRDIEYLTPYIDVINAVKKSTIGGDGTKKEKILYIEWDEDEDDDNEDEDEDETWTNNVIPNEDEDEIDEDEINEEDEIEIIEGGNCDLSYLNDVDWVELWGDD